MQAQLAELRKLNAELAAQNQALMVENRLLRQKVDFLLGRMFGRKSEKLDPRQLEFLLEGLVEDSPNPDDPPPTPKPPRRSRSKVQSRMRLSEDLPCEDVIIEPEAVKQNPEAFECIGEEITHELDVVPTRYFRRRLIRRKFVRKADRGRPPIIAALPERLIPGSVASPGLLTDIILKKYADHLPLHRQEQILRSRHGIELSRKTMCDWVGVVADWLKPLYNHIREDLLCSGYLQVDETPVRYCLRPGGGSAQGYFWVYHTPGKDVLFAWHTGRGAVCLDAMLAGFRGTGQSDGYGVYLNYADQRLRQVEAQLSDLPIALAACWAHARRKFHDARGECPSLAGWVLGQIGLMYRIERGIRGQAPVLRQAVRSSQTAMILARLEKALKRKRFAFRPQSLMGKAISYALTLWKPLLRFRDDGRLEIDNNLIENAIRPTAVGKKNWLFVGHPEAGQRSAILYTLLASCKRLGINPRDYLHDVLSRLPSMTNWQTKSLTPANWLAERRKSNAA